MNKGLVRGGDSEDSSLFVDSRWRDDQVAVANFYFHVDSRKRKSPAGARLGVDTEKPPGGGFHRTAISFSFP